MSLRQIDNELYRRLGHAWWDDNVGEFSTLRFFVNPVRFAYFARVLREGGHRQPDDNLLDVGCGGGVLAEEFARAGYHVTGIDPAPESIATAEAHATASGLSVRYQLGVGERLPIADRAFAHVACCDVLEHVDDVERVVAEIARVLRPGGTLLFDTLNRTVRSWIAVIKVMQDWRATAFAEPNSHVWHKFIRPAELRRVLARHGLELRQLRGIVVRAGPVSIWREFRRRARGEISFRELGRRLQFHEGDDLSVSYMGYAVRTVAIT